ncbi:MAG: prepilin-type N-terminal cleavage/methylation domain-containing protein [Pseudomonadota bacterium]
MTGRRLRPERGFTMVEMMVGMIIFIVGLVGFAGMVGMQAQGNRMAQGADDSATLLQSAIEDMTNVTWADLGNDAGLPTVNGLTNAGVWTEGPLNVIGEVIGTGTGPYTYYRSIVICTFGDTTAAGATPTYCGSSIGGTNRPPELACDTLGLNSREKMIRVLVSWTDRNGKCHYKAADSLAFQW